jgi:hypothetical protein
MKMMAHGYICFNGEAISPERRELTAAAVGTEGAGCKRKESHATEQINWYEV